MVSFPTLFTGCRFNLVFHVYVTIFLPNLRLVLSVRYNLCFTWHSHLTSRFSKKASDHRSRHVMELNMTCRLWSVLNLLQCGEHWSDVKVMSGSVVCDACKMIGFAPENSVSSEWVAKWMRTCLECVWKTFVMPHTFPVLFHLKHRDLLNFIFLAYFAIEWSISLVKRNNSRTKPN